MEVPQAAIDLAKRFEGFHRVPRADPARAHPYICPAGFWTIGYGHLCNSAHPPISVVEAEVYLAHDLQTALAATLRYCPALVTEPEGRPLLEQYLAGLDANSRNAELERLAKVLLKPTVVE
jgi:lysozyme